MQDHPVALIAMKPPHVMLEVEVRLLQANPDFANHLYGLPKDDASEGDTSIQA
jgi:hypothetical protein